VYRDLQGLIWLQTDLIKVFSQKGKEMKKNGLIYRGFHPGDEVLIKDLYTRVFKKKRSLPQWQWEFMDTPEGSSNIRVIEDDGKIIGHVALIPLRFQYFDREIIVGKSEDSSLRKEYRGRRLFGKLEHECFETAAEKGFSISYSISRTAKEVHMKAGYHPLKAMQGYFIPLKPLLVTNEVARTLQISGFKKEVMKVVMRYLAQRFYNRSKRRKAPESNLKIEKVERFDESLDELWRTFITQHKVITIKRSANYLNWRFVEKPDQDYGIYVARSDNKLVGYLITTTVQRKEDFHTDLRIGVTSDFLILGNYQYALRPLFMKAVDYWITDDCDCVINWIHQDSLYANAIRKELKRYGFVSMLGKFSIPISVRALRDDVLPSEFYNEKNWFITLAFSGRWA
jgi:hypothetical protein